MLPPQKSDALIERVSRAATLPDERFDASAVGGKRRFDPVALKRTDAFYEVVTPTVALRLLARARAGDEWGSQLKRLHALTGCTRRHALVEGKADCVARWIIGNLRQIPASR